MHIVEIDGLGYCGGLLVLTSKGRPLEFHCTAPVSTNRAQTILYGKTLNGFLFYDQIGKALCEKAKYPMDILVVSQVELADLTSEIGNPVVVVDRENPRPELVSPDANETNQGVKIFQPATRSDGKTTSPIHTKSLIAEFTETVPLAEPFERIELAIKEAHSVAA